jgi:hypothetical protein
MYCCPMLLAQYNLVWTASRVKDLNTIDGMTPVRQGFDDGQVAALIDAFDAQPGDLLLLIGGK